MSILAITPGRMRIKKSLIAATVSFKKIQAFFKVGPLLVK
jgi:hypothetical protein